MEKRKKKKRIILICVAAILVVLLVWSIWGNKALELNNITVTSKNLPKSFDGYKIALVSDLHNAEFGKNNIKLIELLNEASPDIIAMTGDIIDSRHTDIEIAVEFARQAVEIAPCYYVSGNHEGRLEADEYKKFVARLEELGVNVLNDEEAIIEKNGEKISIIGIDDIRFNYKDVTAERLNSMTSLDSYSVLLCHRPDYFDEISNSGIDLALCGHVHGGQFRLPFVGGILSPDSGFFPEYDSGLYTSGDSNMIVSRGLGNSVVPLRFNNRPEVVLIELKSEI